MKGTDITAAHLGRRFRVKLKGGALVEGMLDWYQQQAAVIEERMLCEGDSTYATGAVTTILHLHGVLEEFEVGPDNTVTLMN